jgi:EAL domain-containing protein (putative c-di-GMP-specific phosphodiesterase class I)/DNA-binding CsgD family transcriptional regulator/CheY-like chemotaxis protein
MTMRVLVFDDDAVAGRLVTRIATMSGMDAMAVTNAAAFAQHMETDPPQVIVLDLQLGDTDGVQQLHVLAERQYAGSLILISGFDAKVLETASTLARSFGLKVEATLEKPLRATALQQILERLHSAGQSQSTERILAAIVNDELSLDFQPVVTCNPPKLKKLEALVRWDHPGLGRIPPDEFLPVAERDSGTIDALTEWVIGAAIEAYGVLAELGISVPLAVNISARNLHDLTFPDRLERRLRDSGMPARHMCLEITETAAFGDSGSSMDILTRLRLKGMLLSIDDFGVGYSSLKMLRQMPFTEIKIDQSFIRDITTSRDSRAIAKSIIDLAANMEMLCVAEGIETKAAADLVEQLGVCGLQGYFIAYPMPVETVSAWLASWNGTASVAPPVHTSDQTSDQASDNNQEEITPPAAVPVPGEPGKRALRLSPRQLEVMRLLSQGKSVKEIARHLELGVGTVKVHLAQAYASLGAHNRVEAILRSGLFT